METEMKQITFSKHLLQNAQLRAQESGLTFNEYVRHLVVNDTSEAVEMVTPQEERAIANSLRDIAEGRYVTLKGSKQIRKHFKNLIKK